MVETGQITGTDRNQTGRYGAEIRKKIFVGLGLQQSGRCNMVLLDFQAVYNVASEACLAIFTSSTGAFIATGPHNDFTWPLQDDKYHIY